MFRDRLKTYPTNIESINGMQTTISTLIALATLLLCSPAGAGTDKTLVSWVALADTTQQGGSA